MVWDVIAKFPITFNGPCLSGSKERILLKSIFTHTIFINDAPVIVCTSEQIAHCLSTLVCLSLRQKKMGGWERSRRWDGGEWDEDRGLGHLLPVYCVCQDLLLMGAPSAWGLASLLTPHWLQMETHCLFCSPCSCACVCVFSLPECCPCCHL